MKKVTTRVFPVGDLYLNQNDADLFARYMWEMRHLNCFDPGVMGYPRTVVIAADTPEEPILFVPLQSVLMFESLAPKPGLSPRMEALALARIGETVDEIAAQTKHREVYFLCKDDRVSDLCRNHGYEELEGYRVLRRKISPKKGGGAHEVSTNENND